MVVAKNPFSPLALRVTASIRMVMTAVLAMNNSRKLGSYFQDFHVLFML